MASSGDPIRREGMKNLEYLLGCGVKVSLVYGDRDQRCPWLGGEQLSLATKWSGADSFNAAGYEFVQTNDSYNGGIVRQHGNLSFSRVFEAGHDRTYLVFVLCLRVLLMHFSGAISARNDLQNLQSSRIRQRRGNRREVHSWIPQRLRHPRPFQQLRIQRQASSSATHQLRPRIR